MVLRGVLQTRELVIYMKIERVDDKTVKCFISNEELEEYNIEYKDFLLRSEKAREIVHDIMEQAVEEVGFKPPKFAFDIQLMMFPDQGLMLTFSEKDPMDSKEGQQLMEAIRDVKEMMEMAKANAKSIPDDNKPKKAADAISDIPEYRKSDIALFMFDKLSVLIDYCRDMPSGLRIKSSLYKANDKYFLLLEKGAASYDRYSRACVQALEFSTLFSADIDRINFFTQRAECLIPEKTLKKLGK